MVSARSIDEFTSPDLESVDPIEQAPTVDIPDAEAKVVSLAGDACSINLREQRSMSSMHDEATGMKQDLMGIIRLQDHTVLAVVQVEEMGMGDPDIVLSRIATEDDAPVRLLSSNEPGTRTFLDSNTLQRVDVEDALGKDISVTNYHWKKYVVHSDSDAQVELITPKEVLPEPPVEEVATTGLAKFLGRMRNRNSAEQIPEPEYDIHLAEIIEEPSKWAVDPQVYSDHLGQLIHEAEGKMDVEYKKLIGDELLSGEEYEILTAEVQSWLSGLEAGHDVDFIHKLHKGKRGGKLSNGGLTYASIALADAINTNRQHHVLYHSVDTKSAAGHEDPIPLTEDEYDNLISSAPDSVLESIGIIMKDMSYPLTPEQQAASGLPILPARSARDARLVREHNRQVWNGAGLCGRAEGYFMKDSRVLRDLEIDGEVVAIQKTKTGENVALLTQPAILNGVRLPVGTMLTVDDNNLDSISYGFGRLSAFTAENPSQLFHISPHLLKDHNVRDGATGRGYSDIQQKLGRAEGRTVRQLLESLQRDAAEGLHDDAIRQAASDIIATRQAITSIDTDAYLAKGREIAAKQKEARAEYLYLRNNDKDNKAGIAVSERRLRAQELRYARHRDDSPSKRTVAMMGELLETYGADTFKKAKKVLAYWEASAKLQYSVE